MPAESMFKRSSAAHGSTYYSSATHYYWHCGRFFGNDRGFSPGFAYDSVYPAGSFLFCTLITQVSPLADTESILGTNC